MHVNAQCPRVLAPAPLRLVIGLILLAGFLFTIEKCALLFLSWGPGGQQYRHLIETQSLHLPLNGMLVVLIGYVTLYTVAQKLFSHLICYPAGAQEDRYSMLSLRGLVFAPYAAEPTPQAASAALIVYALQLLTFPICLALV
jgi:hypothetical protein